MLALEDDPVLLHFADDKHAFERTVRQSMVTEESVNTMASEGQLSPRMEAVVGVLIMAFGVFTT
jgi:hypothetical protein